MEELAFSIGVLLAIGGPLLLIPVIWLVYRLAVRRIVVTLLATRVGRRGARWLALAVSVALVASALAVSYFPGKREFDRLCAAHATPTVSAAVQADGFFRTRLYPYEAARWLKSFAYVEAPHMYEDGVHVRYTRVGDDIRQDDVTTLLSHYGVREDLVERAHGIVMTEKTVYELATERELARAASIVYQGGPLALLLGVYGMSSCPDIRSDQGSRDFRTFYDLETIMLRAGEPPAVD